MTHRNPLWLAGLLALVLAVAGGCSDDAKTSGGGYDVIQPDHREPPRVDAPWRGTGDEIDVSVWEMHCGGCEGQVERAVGQVEGVTSVEADHETSLVRIRIADPARRAALLPALREAIHAAGKQVVGEDALDPE